MFGHGFLMLAVEVSPYMVGEWAGRVLVLGLALIGLIRCLAILGRADISSKCVTSLILVLAGIVFASLASGLAAALPEQNTLQFIAPGARILLVSLAVAAMIVSLLAILDYQEKRKIYKHGITQATIALVLCSLILTSEIIAYTRGASIWTRWRPRITLSRGESLIFDEYNFRLSRPAEPWKQAAPKDLDAFCQVAFSRFSPALSFAVRAEQLGPGFDSLQLAEAGKARLRNTLKSERVLAQVPQLCNGLVGVEVVTRGSREGRDSVAVQWYCFTNGYGYQLITQGAWHDKDTVLRQAEMLQSWFECIDFARTTEARGIEFETNFLSRTYHYEVGLTNSLWRKWVQPQRLLSWAEFSARRQDGVYLAVAPACFGEELDEDAVISAMLSLLGIDYPDEKLTNRRRLEKASLAGTQFDYERSVDDVPWHYRIQILHYGGFAWLALAWTERYKQGSDEMFADALDRINFGSLPAQGPPLLELTARERAAHGLLLNQASHYYYEHRNYQKARILCQAAYEAEPQPLYFRNALIAWLHLDTPAEALIFIEKALESHPKVHELRAYLALFQGRAGKVDEAISNYAKLFAEGFWAPDQFSEYIQLLIRAQRFDDALAVVREQATKDTSILPHMLEALIFSGKGDYEHAIAILKTEYDKAPSNQELGRALVLAYFNSGKNQEARALCAELLKEEPNEWELFSLKGRSEAALGLYDEAKASLEQALKGAPSEPRLRKELELLSALLGQSEK